MRRSLKIFLFALLFQSCYFMYAQSVQPSGQSRGSIHSNALSGTVPRVGSLHGAFHLKSRAHSTVSKPSGSPSNRKLNISFLFHANQNLVPYGKVADYVCFRGLLTTLRRHPTQKFMIHFAGTLIHDMLWFGDSTLDILRQGIQDGQFEIVGSCYNQNIMYSTRLDTNDFEFNDHQIKIHKAEIENILGAVPVTFWNPERVWTQNFTQLLADNGYKYVQVEDHILDSSGATPPVYRVRTTEYNGRQMTVFEDDKEFLALVANAIAVRDPSGVISYLNEKYAEDSTGVDVIGYYQDAEATGLWQFEDNQDPQLVFDGLDALLSAIEQDTLINVTNCSTYMQTHSASEDLTPILDGAAAWMGSTAWFAENMSPEFNTMRAVYNGLRNTLDSISTVIAALPANPAADSLMQHAWFTLCAHQFEFGCAGLEGEIYDAQLQLARTCIVSAEAALYAANPTTTSFVADIDRDGINEAVMVTPQNLYVFSRVGGRLLYWFDLVHGEELVGDEDFSADYSEPYVSDNLALPLIRGGIDTYSWLSGNTIHPEVLGWTFIVRKRALNDFLTIGAGSEQSLANATYNASLSGDSLSFTTSTGGINIQKDIVATATGLTVTYHLNSTLASSTTISHRIENGLSPSYRALLNGGRTSLAYTDGAGDTSSNPTASTVGVRNNVTGNFVHFAWQNTPDSLLGNEEVFALGLNPVYMSTLNPGDFVSYGFSLSANQAVTSVPSGSRTLPTEYTLRQNYPNPFNPTTTIRYELPKESFVQLSIYNVLGQEVQTLVNTTEQPGEKAVQFEGSNFSTGIYFYRIVATSSSNPTNRFTQTRKMLLIK